MRRQWRSDGGGDGVLGGERVQSVTSAMGVSCRPPHQPQICCGTACILAQDTPPSVSFIGKKKRVGQRKCTPTTMKGAGRVLANGGHFDGVRRSTPPAPTLVKKLPCDVLVDAFYRVFILLRRHLSFERGRQRGLEGYFAVTVIPQGVRTKQPEVLQERKTEKNQEKKGGRASK